MDGAPPTKKQKSDGNLEAVDKSILLAAKDHEKWIAERRKNWPSKQRVAEKQAEEASKPSPTIYNTTSESNSEPPSSPKAQSENNSTQKKPICRYFLRGRCNAGNRCRFSHERPESKPSRPPHERVYKRFEPPTKASLFVKLLQSDHDAEDERLLEFIEYLHSHNKIRRTHSDE